MSDENQSSDDNPQNQANAQNEKHFALQKLYVKDLSFETPNSPAIFTEKWEPNVNVELNTNGKHLSEDIHEVVLGITVTAKIGEKIAYLCEVHQAGVFALNGFSEQELGPMLGSYCPNILFPYVREVISDLVNKGGFPQMLLQPVNFDAIYMDHVKRQQAQQGADAEEDASGAVH